MITLEQKQEEITKNYAYYEEILPEIRQTRAGQYLLLRKKNEIAYFNDILEALRYADDNFDDGLYSVQKVDAPPIDLGFFSHVYHQGNP